MLTRLCSSPVIGVLESQWDFGSGATKIGIMRPLVAPAAEIASAIPESVALGYHGCFGTLSGWPSRQPPDLGGTVMLLNAAIAASGRRVDFLHLPTLGTADDAFFLLERLRAPERPGRLLTAEGSAPPPDILDITVRDHLNAVELPHEAGG
jgi:hypothetical protein